jgi:CheY-like chemotaxis protein
MQPKLLLADDSVTIQRVIELTFADENVQVVAVGDGKQAIDRVVTDQPDIVLADVGMPERDGYEVAAFIKSQPQLAHIPVLLLTGAFEPIDEARARSAGCDGVLVKPFEPQMVISRVRDLLSGRRAQPESKPAGAADPRAQEHATAPGPGPGAAEATSGGAAEEKDAAQGKDKESGGSLEDYFDRLDAALATLAPGQSPPPQPTFEPAPQVEPPAPPRPVLRPVSRAPEPIPVKTGDPLGGWDPDLAAGEQPAPVAPALVPPAQSAAPGAATSPGAPPPPASPPEAAPPMPLPGAAAPESPASGAVAPAPSLSDAFAALLAAEEGQPVPQAMFGASAPASPVLTDDVIDEIVRRVIARMGDETMRRAVLDAAERLVREEIERIKRQAG